MPDIPLMDPLPVLLFWVALQVGAYALITFLASVRIASKN